MHPPHSVRTVSLTERSPVVRHLRPEDAAFLLANHRAHVEIALTPQRHVYHLTARGYVGVLIAPRCRFSLRPKIPLANLFHLLDPLGSYPSTPDAVTPAGGDTVVNFLAGQFARLLGERGAIGLHRDYRERAEEGPFLRGRLDVSAQMREGVARKDRLHSRDDAFTADVPYNRVLKGTAEQLLASPLLDDEVRAAMRQSLRPFAEVASPPANVADCDNLLSLPLPAAYRPLLGFCRLLLGALRPGEETGPVPAPAFLLDMERVFERYLTERLTAAFAESASGYRVTAQPLIAVSEAVAGQPDLSVRPDLTLGDDRIRAIVDAKWKRLDDSPLVTADVYQMLAYCTSLGASRGVLVYPGRRDRRWEYRLTGSPITLTIRTLRVVGAGEQLAASAARLARFLRRQAAAARREA